MLPNYHNEANDLYRQSCLHPLRLKQLEVRQPSDDREMTVRTIPIEDIGVVLLGDPQITITHALLGALLENNCAIVTCSATHMPSGLLLPLDGHTL